MEDIHHGEWDNDLQEGCDNISFSSYWEKHQCDFKKCCKKYKKPGKKHCKKCPKR